MKGIKNMFNYVSGDILASSAKCLINTVNCEGFMGKGIAYQFKHRFPKNNDDYVLACHSQQLYIGTIHTFEENGKIIINFPTKRKWREKSKIDYIHKGMEKVAAYLKEHNISSVAIPPLGCGNGGLKWTDVKPVIIQHLTPIQAELDIQIYEPANFSRSTSIKSPKRLSMPHLILMQTKLHLKKKTKNHLQKATYFFSLLSKSSFFQFTKQKNSLYSPDIETASREIKSVQDYYNFQTAQCFDFVKNQVISTSTEKDLVKHEKTIRHSTDFVNNLVRDEMSEKQMDLIFAILFLLHKQPQDKTTLSSELHAWFATGQNLITPEDIRNSLAYLQKKDILTQNVFFQYELTIKNNQ